MGKYDKVLDKLTKMPVADVSWQAEVETAKSKIQLTDTELIQAYVGLRGEKDQADEVLSHINLMLEAYKQLLADAYEAKGITSMKLDTGPSVSIQLEPKAKVEDRDAFREWCIENDLERSLVLPWQTANALTKERLLKGQPEPDGVTAYIYTKIVLRKK